MTNHMKLPEGANVNTAHKDSGDVHLCVLCGHPMPPGEEMFRFHGYSGPCPAETPDSDKTAKDGE